MEVNSPSSVRRCPTRWSRPRQGQLNLNADVGCRRGCNFISVGAAVRDFAGVVVARLAKKLKGFFSPHIVECLALREGLEFVRDLGLGVSMTEMNTLKVVQAVASPSSLDEADGIISDVRLLLQQVSGGLFCGHVSREGNVVAHLLANNVFSHSAFMERT